jgi:hypothetical protein
MPRPRKIHAGSFVEGSPQEVWSRFSLHKNHQMVEAHYRAWKALKEN